MALSLDGSVAVYGGNSDPTVTGTLTCSNAGNVIVVAVLSNGADVTGVTASGATFTKHAEYVTNNIEIWTGYASGTFSSAITVDFDAAPGYTTVHAFGVNGCPSSSYFDANASVPDNGATDPRTISTNTADTFIIGAFRFATTALPTAGTGFTEIFGSSGNGYFLTEYKIVSATQSSLSVPVGTGVGDSNGAIATALVMDGGGGGTVALGGSVSNSGQTTPSLNLSVQL